MPLGDADLRDIVERASSFSERRNGGFEFSELVDDNERVDALLMHWRQLIAPGDSVTFERRLAWDGLDEAAGATCAVSTASRSGRVSPPLVIDAARCRRRL